MLQNDPNDASTRDRLAAELYHQGKIDQAIEHWTEVIKLAPEWAEAMNNLAWVLAAANDESLHNTDEAVRLAERACELTKYESAGMLDTLAVGYAAAGRFSDAIGTTEKAVELAQAAGEQELAEDIQKRLELYKTNKVYRD
jgi:tetratricopeptide (TPR) repeat protein